jgi:hypothetical protein
LAAILPLVGAMAGHGSSLSARLLADGNIPIRFPCP